MDRGKFTNPIDVQDRYMLKFLDMDQRHKENDNIKVKSIVRDIERMTVKVKKFKTKVILPPKNVKPEQIGDHFHNITGIGTKAQAAQSITNYSKDNLKKYKNLSSKTVTEESKKIENLGKITSQKGIYLQDFKKSAIAAAHSVSNNEKSQKTHVKKVQDKIETIIHTSQTAEKAEKQEKTQQPNVPKSDIKKVNNKKLVQVTQQKDRRSHKQKVTIKTEKNSQSEPVTNVQKPQQEVQTLPYDRWNIYKFDLFP